MQIESQGKRISSVLESNGPSQLDSKITEGTEKGLGKTSFEIKTSGQTQKGSAIKHARSQDFQAKRPDALGGVAECQSHSDAQREF